MMNAQIFNDQVRQIARARVGETLADAMIENANALKFNKILRGISEASQEMLMLSAIHVLRTHVHDLVDPELTDNYGMSRFLCHRLNPTHYFGSNTSDVARYTAATNERHAVHGKTLHGKIDRLFENLDFVIHASNGDEVTRNVWVQISSAKNRSAAMRAHTKLGTSEDEYEIYNESTVRCNAASYDAMVKHGFNVEFAHLARHVKKLAALSTGGNFFVTNEEEYMRLIKVQTVDALYIALTRTAWVNAVIGA